MADNVTANSGSGGATFATDEISGVHYPRNKLVLGADGANDGDVCKANPLPIGANTAKDGSGTLYAPLVDSDGHLQMDVLALPALPAGTNAVGKLAANDGVDIGDVTINNAAGGGVYVRPGTSAVFAVWGDVAHDAADSGNPLKTGGKAVSAEPAAVADGDRVHFVADLCGRQIVAPYCNPENIVTGYNSSAITDTTSTQIVAAQGAGVRFYCTSITVTNADADTGTLVQITDGSGGAVLWQGYAREDGGGATITFPTPIRTSANTALHAACGTSGATVYVAASGYKGA